MATGIGSPLALGGLYPSVDGRYVAANGKPFTSVSNAESALNGFPSKLSESCVGLTVLVADENDPDYPKAKEYWVQPKGTTPETYGLVEKGAGTTDYNDLNNKPTINNVPLGDNKTASDLSLATAKQGGKADTAIQGVSVNGTEVTPDPATKKVALTIENGKSAYQLYLDDYEDKHGSTDGALNEAAWLESLQGKSALQIYNETMNTSLDEAGFINVLKQNYPMEYVAYNQAAAEQSIGTAFAAIDQLAASDSTAGKLYLMPNDGTTPTGTELFITVQTGATTYMWYRLGALSVPSNVLTEDKIVQDLNIGGADKVPSAAVIKEFKEDIVGVDTKDINTVTLVRPQPDGVHIDYMSLTPTSTSGYVFYDESGSTVRTKAVEINTNWSQLKVTNNNSNESYLVFLKNELTTKQHWYFNDLLSDDFVCDGVSTWSEIFVKVESNSTSVVDIPTDAKWCYVSVRTYNSTAPREPSIESISIVHTNGELDRIREEIRGSEQSLDNYVPINRLIGQKNFESYIISDSANYIKQDSVNSGTHGQSGYTDFIPIDDVKGLRCSAPFLKSTGNTTFYACYIYDSNKSYIRALTGTNAVVATVYVKQEGDAYVRFNLAEGAVITELTDEQPTTYSMISGYPAAKLDINTKVGDVNVFEVVPGGKNLCNPATVVNKAGAYISGATGDIVYSSSATNAKGFTDFIPMNGKNVVCNKGYTGGTQGWACYDKNYHYTHGSVSNGYARYVEGDVYVRFTLNSVVDVQVEYGTTPTEYEPFEQPVLRINSELANGEGEKGSVYDGVSIVIPNDVYVTQGDQIYLYHKSIIKAADIHCVALGVSYGDKTRELPRYVKLTNKTVETRNIVLDLYDSNLNSIAQKTITVHTVAKPTSPASNVNILLIGASRHEGGETLGEMLRRLTGRDGNPVGLGLSNIRIVGQRRGTTTGYTNIEHQAQRGRPIHDIVEGDGFTYTIQLVGENTFALNDTYTFTSAAGSWVLKITGSESQDNVIHCEYVSGTGSFSDVFAGITSENPGTLTRTSGAGSESMQFTSIIEESTNPFWYNGGIDFAHYAENCITPVVLPEKIGILIISRMLNDFGVPRTPLQIVQDYKTIVDAFHAYNPDGRVIINTEPLPSPNGGIGLDDTTYLHPRSTYYGFAKLCFEVYEQCIKTFVGDYASYVIISATNAEFDGENLYPSSSYPTGLRGTKKEVLQNNALHYTTTGDLAVADSLYHCVCKCINDINAL